MEQWRESALAECRVALEGSLARFGFAPVVTPELTRTRQQWLEHLAINAVFAACDQEVKSLAADSFAHPGRREPVSDALRRRLEIKLRRILSGELKAFTFQRGPFTPATALSDVLSNMVLRIGEGYLTASPSLENLLDQRRPLEVVRSRQDP